MKWKIIPKRKKKNKEDPIQLTKKLCLLLGFKEDDEIFCKPTKAHYKRTNHLLINKGVFNAEIMQLLKNHDHFIHYPSSNTAAIDSIMKLTILNKATNRYEKWMFLFQMKLYSGAIGAKVMNEFQSNIPKVIKFLPELGIKFQNAKIVFVTTTPLDPLPGVTSISKVKFSLVRDIEKNFPILKLWLLKKFKTFNSRTKQNFQ